MTDANFVEHEGEILPAYTGVNQPRYPRHEGDKVPDHSFSSAEPTTIQPTETVPVEQRAENPYWPTQQQREMGRTGITGAREILTQVKSRQ